MTVSAPPRPPRPNDSVRRPPRLPRPTDHVEHAEPEALIEEARQRARRRRRMYGAVATFSVLVGLAVATIVEGAAPPQQAALGLAAPPSAVGSAASSQIAFVSSTTWALGATDCCAELRVINPDGSEERTLTRLAAMGGAQPVWSPDGRRIVFVSAPGFSEEIAVINADGSGKQILTHHPASDQGPVWSPDGRKIAFTRASYALPADTSVFTMNADGSGKRMLAQGAGPVWSPDGRKIAYGSGDGGVHVVNADGGGQLTLGRGSGPLWSPDGRKVAYTGDSGGVFVVNADGSGRRKLARGTGPLWSPDGRKIAYGGVPGGVFVVDADGTGKRRLSHNASTWGDAPSSWSPDGQRILFSRFVGHGRYGPAKVLSYVMGADGSGKSRLTQHGGQSVWSPDGRMIAVSSGHDGTAAIHVVHADGSGSRRIARLYASGLELAWSPARRT